MVQKNQAFASRRKWGAMLKKFLMMMVVVSAATSANAGDLDHWQTRVGEAMSNYRVAVNYLRTGNIDLAAIALEDMLAGWAVLAKQYSAQPPAPFTSTADHAAFLQTVEAAATKSLALIDAGKPGPARTALKPTRAVVYNWRTRYDIQVLADCIFEANQAMAPLLAYRRSKPDLADPGTQAKVLEAISAAAIPLPRCDKAAAPEVRADAQFRRLIDNSQVSLKAAAKAVRNQQPGALFRYLIEVASFDRLLFFGFG